VHTLAAAVRAPGRARRIAVLVVLLLGWAVAGCGAREGTRISVADAARFAGFRLPASAEPVGAYEETGIDHLAAFAVRLPPEALDRLLAEARFTVPLEPGRRVFLRPVPGTDLDSAASFAAGQDRRQVGDSTVTRDVMVVTDDPRRTLVHVWAFTT
jgi:hypothetical protein